MMSIISLFLAVVWLIMPFVVFAMKCKQDRSLEVLEEINKRLVVLEQQITRLQPSQATCEATVDHTEEAVITPCDPPLQPEVLPLA
jgi:hypothetical protein